MSQGADPSTKDLSGYEKYIIAHIWPGNDITDEIRETWEQISRTNLLKIYGGAEDYILEEAKLDVCKVNPMLYGSINYGYDLDDNGLIPLGPVVIGYRAVWVKGCQRSRRNEQS